MASSSVGKFSFGDRKVVLGGTIACIILGGGAYYYYRSSKGNSNITESTVSSEVESLLDAQGMKESGNKYFKKGDYEKAIECYTQAIELCTEDNISELSTYYQNRAAAWEQLKDWANVVKDCTFAIEKNPRYTKALHRRAKAYEVLDEKRNCLEDVTAVCLLEGFSNQQCMELADRILKGIGKDLAADNYCKRPRVLPSANSIKTYLDSFSNNVFVVTSEENPTPEEAAYMKILESMNENNFENILPMCDEIVDSNTTTKHQVRATLLRGTLKSLMNDNEGSLHDFTKVIEADNNDGEINELIIDALIKRASLKIQQEDEAGCFADLEMAIGIDDRNVNIYHSRGQLYSHKDRDDEAAIEYRKAISLDASYIQPRIQLGYCLCKVAMQRMSTSTMKEANDILEETCRLFPHSSDAFSMYGQLLQDQQRCEEAMSRLDKAISLSPTTATTLVYKALLLLQWKKDKDGATELIRKAIDLDEKCDFAYETLASLEVQAGNVEEALRLFERSLQLVRSEAEMANTYSLLEAAKAQAKITERLGIQLTPNAALM